MDAEAAVAAVTVQLEEMPVMFMAAVAAATVEKVEMLLGHQVAEVAATEPMETAGAELIVPEDLPLVVLAVAMAVMES